VEEDEMRDEFRCYRHPEVVMDATPYKNAWYIFPCCKCQKNYATSPLQKEKKEPHWFEFLEKKLGLKK
jgi:hypothetical protein